MKTLSFVALTMLLLTACDSSKPNIELIQDMMDQPSYKAQDYDPTKPDGLAMRVPPEGTVPRGIKPYPFKADEAELAGKKLVSPFPGSVEKDVMDRGRERYETNCAVCHGTQGRGDGPVAAKMPVRPPALLSALIKGYPDGRLFHVITMGKGVMGSYANQVGKPEDRWALVAYIRSLQKTYQESK